MASLYFADQRRQQAEVSASSPSPSAPRSGRTRSTAGTSPTPPISNNNNNKINPEVIGEMSYVGDDGIHEQQQQQQQNMNSAPLPVPVPPPPPYNEKTDEITGDVVLDAVVEPIGDDSNGYYSGRHSVSSDITENTGRAGPPGHHVSSSLPSSNNNDHTRQQEAPEEIPESLQNIEEEAASNNKNKGINRSSSDSNNNNRSLWIAFSILCCILVAGGAGAGVGIALSSKNDNAEPPSVESVSGEIPTLAPVKPPPTAVKVTTAPTIPIPTRQPTAPTIAPTTRPPVNDPPNNGIPLNDQCNTATVISTVTSSFGSTESATSHPELASATVGCAIDEEAKGVWCRVNGNGALLEASTCGDSQYDTKLSIFEGSCDSLSCVVSNDDADDTECQLLSTAVWPSEEGTAYYILVRVCLLRIAYMHKPPCFLSVSKKNILMFSIIVLLLFYPKIRFTVFKRQQVNLNWPFESNPLKMMIARVLFQLSQMGHLHPGRQYQRISTLLVPVMLKRLLLVSGK